MRVEAKLKKAVREAEHHGRGLSAIVARYQRNRVGLAEALCQLMVDPSHPFWRRQSAAELLSNNKGALGLLLRTIAAVADGEDTSLMASCIGLCPGKGTFDAASRRLFLKIFANGSEEEQLAAVEAISLIERPFVRRALIGLVTDTAAPLEIRERATEMLHLHDCRETALVCAQALNDPQPSIRFWAAYTLGQIDVFRVSLLAIAIPALETVLNDEQVAPGWWSVGQEALAGIVDLRHDPAEQKALQAQLHRILTDPNASPEDRRWAECYRT